MNAHGSRITSITKELGTTRPLVFRTIDKALAFVPLASLDDIQRSGRSRVIDDAAKSWVMSLLERYLKTIKSECMRPRVTLSLDEARAQITGFIAYYNDERLHSAIGYIIAPKDKLEGREEQIFKDRDRKLKAARAVRKLKRGSRTMRENAAPLVADWGRTDKVKPPAGALRDPVGPAQSAEP